MPVSCIQRKHRLWRLGLCWCLLVLWISTSPVQGAHRRPPPQLAPLLPSSGPHARVRVPSGRPFRLEAVRRTGAKDLFLEEGIEIEELMPRSGMSCEKEHPLHQKMLRGRRHKRCPRNTNRIRHGTKCGFLSSWEANCKTWVRKVSSWELPKIRGTLILGAL